MARKYNDFDEPEGDGVFDQFLTIVGERKREFAIACVTAAVVLLGLIVWGSYPDEDNASNERVPIVRADVSDYKMTPDNPGGMEIPYRDSTVFSAGSQTNTGTENILADNTSEQPVPRSQLFAGLNTEGEPMDSEGQQVVMAEEMIGDISEEVPFQEMAKASEVEPVSSNNDIVQEAIGSTATAKVEEVAPPAQEKLAAAVTPAPAPVKKTEPVSKQKTEKSASSVAKIEPAAGAASTAAKAVTPGGYYVQVGAVRSQSGAAGEWTKIQAKYSALGGLKYRTQEANLGAKGVFYRIQAGPMSKDSADSICARMKSQTPGACLVTK
jgi:cell division protein FtsN